MTSQRVRNDYETVQATHEARLYAEAALDAEQKKYENGKSTLFDILGLQAKLTSARFDEITRVGDLQRGPRNSVV